jgi:hypothetical protein
MYVHWNRVGSAWNEDGAEETDREEKSHEDTEFPCAKHAMNFVCFLTSFLQLARYQIYADHVAVKFNKWLYRRLPATTAGYPIYVKEALVRR